MEQFKAVQGYEQYYEVSNLGRVKSLPRWRTWGNRTYLTKERFLTPSLHHTGYYTVGLCQDFKLQTRIIHLLVINAFVPKVEGKDFANHIDRNPLNNKAENLEWVNRSENTLHSTGLRGRKNKYPGVSRADTVSERYFARTKANGKLVHLGTFLTKELAYEAYLNYFQKNNIINKYI